MISSFHHIFSRHLVEYHWACIETSHQTPAKSFLNKPISEARKGVTRCSILFDFLEIVIFK